jgi:hypothetical protein
LSEFFQRTGRFYHRPEGISRQKLPLAAKKTCLTDKIQTRLPEGKGQERDQQIADMERNFIDFSLAKIGALKTMKTGMRVAFL